MSASGAPIVTSPWEPQPRTWDQAASAPPFAPPSPPAGQYATTPFATPPVAPNWAPPNPPPPLPTGGGAPTSSRGGAWKVILAIFIALALLVSGFLVGRTTGDGTDGAQSPNVEDAREAGLPTQAPVQGESDEPIAAVAEAVSPAVVQIETSQGGTPLGVGSGVVYDPDGLIITNSHVVEGADAVQVRMADGTMVDGEVLGADPSTDIAVVRIPSSAVIDVAVLALGEEVRVGQLAVAIGSPFGFDQTVTSGIVSAVGRPFPNDEQILVAMIQTDAPINQGNSGGALVDREGRVIGINSAIVSQSGDNNGLGFSIPIDLAYERAVRLAAGESIETPLLGVFGEPTDDGSPGAQITEITAGSGADAAGMEVGDVVTEMDGETIHSFEQLATLIVEHTPGDIVEITVVRDGDTFTLDAELGSR
jgi:putative serine protease PepD